MTLGGVVATSVPSAPVVPRSPSAVVATAPLSAPPVARSFVHSSVFVSETTR